jgi:hypothetical protein
MTKFTAIVPGNNFQILDAKCVILAKQLAGKIPQNGIRYIEESNTVILQSNNLLDILQTVKNGVWAHSTRPVKVQAGWEVIIVPNNQIQSEYGVAAIGVSFTANGPAYFDSEESDTLVWASEAA